MSHDKWVEAGTLTMGMQVDDQYDVAIANMNLSQIEIFQKIWIFSFYTSLSHGNQVDVYGALYIQDGAGFEFRGAGGYLWFRM